MGYGLYNNDTGLFEEASWLDKGLWLENENQVLWIIPNDDTGMEIEGPDDIKFAEGPHKGQYIVDVLNEICAGQTDPDPRNWDIPWDTLGFVVVNECLKRWNPINGYYHA